MKTCKKYLKKFSDPALRGQHAEQRQQRTPARASEEGARAAKRHEGESTALAVALRSSNIYLKIIIRGVFGFDFQKQKRFFCFGFCKSKAKSFVL